MEKELKFIVLSGYEFIDDFIYLVHAYVYECLCVCVHTYLRICKRMCACILLYFLKNSVKERHYAAEKTQRPNMAKKKRSLP